MHLLISGVRGLSGSSRHAPWRRPLLKALGSKLGVEASASTSPVRTSMTTALALCSPTAARRSKRCSSRSMVRAAGPGPGLPSSRSSSRITRPTALTSTRLTPGAAAQRQVVGCARCRSCRCGTPGSSSSGSPSSACARPGRRRHSPAICASASPVWIVARWPTSIDDARQVRGDCTSMRGDLAPSSGSRAP